ncbi:PopC secretion inhibitor PopD [Myxococcus sp. Y35]|uniref:PopC secretion inhibitor PopD n=1 Tax=Pseudomyxococcus flavus TaxID=3115648 RepID=UPI003CEFD581
MSRKNGDWGDVRAGGVPGVSARVRPLPGAAGSDTQPDWIDVTVMPREEPAAVSRGRTSPRPPLRSRAEVHQAGLAESARFHQSLMRWLEAHHLLGAVRSVSEPGSMPMLHLRCAPRVLDQLRRAPEFEAGTMMPLDLI